MLVEAYTRRMTGEGTAYRDRQRRRIWCPYCGAEFAVGYLKTHRQTHHSMGWGDQDGAPPPKESHHY